MGFKFGNRAFEKGFRWFFLFLLVGLSGIPFIYKQPVGNVATLLGVLVLVVILFLKKHRIKKVFLVMVSLYIGISAMQIYTYKVLDPSYLNIALRLILAYGTIHLLGSSFTSRYVKLLYFFSVFSLCLYIPSALVPSVETVLENSIAKPFDLYEGPEMYRPFPSIVVYTFCVNDYRAATGIPRNAGPFWEPGAFGGFLVLAIIFNLLRGQEFFSRQNKIFILALGTTFSTTAYVACFLLYLFYMLLVKKNKYALLGGPLVIALFLLAYNQVDFLGGKVTAQANFDINKADELTRNRMVSAVLDLRDMMESPLVGKGVSRETRFENAEAGTSENHRNNGTTDFLVRFGIPGFFLFFFVGYRMAFRSLAEVGFPSSFYWALVLVILMLGFSEMYFLKPLFLGFPLLLINNNQT